MTGRSPETQADPFSELGHRPINSTPMCDLRKADGTRIGRQIYPAALYVPFQIEPFDRIDYARAHSGHTPFD
jgi:hypothetical protein